MRHALLAKPFTVVAVAGIAAAAVTVAYTTSTPLTTTVTTAPVIFVAGDDTGSTNEFVTVFSIDSTSTFLTSTVKGVAGATLTIDSFFKLTNQHTDAYTVTLSTANVTNSLVTAYTLQVYDASDDSLDATWNLREASSTTSTSFTAAASGTYYVKLTLTLASTATSTNVNLANSISLTAA